MNYLLISCDLDGTLFNSKGEMSEENSQAISELLSLGVQFVPTSGRTLSDIPREVQNHPAVRYIIYSSGAAVLDKQTGEGIFFCFPEDLSHSVLELLDAFETHISVRRLGKTYVDSEKMGDESFSYYNVWSVHAKLLVKYAFSIDNFKSAMSSFDNVEMISVFFKNDSDRKRVQEILSADERLNVVSVCPYNLEIVYKEANKGRALLALANKLSIPEEKTIAVGDSENDLSMISAAGLGLAMANAADFVKARADAVICHCDDHAVKYIKEKYICGLSPEDINQ